MNRQKNDQTDANQILDISRTLRSMRKIDLAPTLGRGIPRWPTHPHLIIDPTMNHPHDGYYCQNVSMAEHSGCHCDAPSHSHASMMTSTIDTFSADHLIAPATVYDFSNRPWRPGDLLTKTDILEYEKNLGCAVSKDEIALVNFGWLRKHWSRDSRAQWYATNSPGMTEEVTILFRERGVRAVGADTIACEVPLVDGVVGGAPGHGLHWLPNKILILECVANLELVSNRCFLVAIPLPIENGSGSPLRPVAYCPN
jgi:kynurenine formamidase